MNRKVLTWFWLGNSRVEEKEILRTSPPKLLRQARGDDPRRPVYRSHYWRMAGVLGRRINLAPIFQQPHGHREAIPLSAGGRNAALRHEVQRHQLRPWIRLGGDHGYHLWSTDRLVPPFANVLRPVSERTLCNAAHRDGAADHHLVRNRDMVESVYRFPLGVLPRPDKYGGWRTGARSGFTARGESLLRFRLAGFHNACDSRIGAVHSHRHPARRCFGPDRRGGRRNGGQQ